MLKVVADTNTIISGLLWKGNESKLLQEAEEENIRLFISKEILEEKSKTNSSGLGIPGIPSGPRVKPCQLRRTL